jgi:SAM-dependent methyltransferase
MIDHFAGRVAERYDETLGEWGDPTVVAATVDFLAELGARKRPARGALELGIGTGRIALPLAARGVSVHGIDLSPDMVAELSRKPGADAIGVTIGDFSSTTVDRTFSLVYVVFNTIMNLTTQDAQVACFANAAAHLEPGGCFVVEVGVPGLRTLPPGETLQVFSLTDEHVGIDEYDVVRQGLVSHHYRPRSGERSSGPFRYVWPSELDLMARLAGMSLRERWQDWDRSPFTADSRKHVSVWEKR